MPLSNPSIPGLNISISPGELVEVEEYWPNLDRYVVRDVATNARGLAARGVLKED